MSFLQETEDGAVTRSSAYELPKKKRVSRNARDKARMLVLEFINVLAQGDLALKRHCQCGIKKSIFLNFVEKRGFKTNRKLTYNNSDAIWTEMKWFVYEQIKTVYGVKDPQNVVFEALEVANNPEFCRKRFGAFLDFSILDQPDDLVMEE